MTDFVVRPLTKTKACRASRRGLAIAASGLLGLLSVSTIVGSVEPTYAQNIVVINGRGFGHGVGLAQDGAYWMGRAGRSATEILRLFFPGTVIAKRGGTVRVPLGGGGSAQLGFPNGGTIGELRVPAGGSVSVRASGGDVIASVLTGFSLAGEGGVVSTPTTLIASRQSSAEQREQVATASVTPSGMGTAASLRPGTNDPAQVGEPISPQDRSMFVALSEIRSSPPLREATLSNGNDNAAASNAVPSNDQSEIVSAAERFQADTPIVSSVVTVPATSTATAPSSAAPTTPTPTNPAPTVPAATNPGEGGASSNPGPSNPAATNPVPTAVTQSAANGAAGSDGANLAAPIVTSVESGAGTGSGFASGVGSASVPLPSGSIDPTNPESTGAISKPRSGTIQGSLLSASSGGATVSFNGRRYRGSIEFNAGTGSLRITNSVDLEDYLKGMGEILTPSWPSAALQSQAIAARTYALRTMAIDGQVCPTQRCQVYLGAQAEYGKMNSAVDATRGKVLTYGGKLAATFYSASGGGTIATPEEGFGGGSSQQPYLKAGSYPTGDVLAWTVRMPLSEVARRVGYGGSPRGVTVTRVGASGRALEVTVDGSSGPLRVGGPKFDAALGLKSTFFTINEPVFGSSGLDSNSGSDATLGSGGSSSDLSSALAALGLSNAVPGAGLEEQSRLLATADPDFAAGSATTLPPFNLVPSASSNGLTDSDGQRSPDFSSSGLGSIGSAAGSGLVADTTLVPTTTRSAPKPTQPDNSAGSTIEAINLPARDSSSSGGSDLVFLAVPTALLGLVGIGLRRRVRANRSANPSNSAPISSPRLANKRPRSTAPNASNASNGSSARRSERPNEPDRANRAASASRPASATRPVRVDDDRAERPSGNRTTRRADGDARRVPSPDASRPVPSPDAVRRRPVPTGTRTRPRPRPTDPAIGRATDGTRRRSESSDERLRSEVTQENPTSPGLVDQ